MAEIKFAKQETRDFTPPPQFVASATISGMDACRALCDEAERDYTGFRARRARENLLWHEPFTRTLDESNAPFYKWFEDREPNASVNCLDRHLGNGNADKTALNFEADYSQVSKPDDTTGGNLRVCGAQAQPAGR